MMSGLKALLLLCFIGALLASSCPLDCSGHGVCQDDDTCECDSNYIGVDCSVYSHTIKEGQTYSGSVHRSEWKYYPLTTSHTETITWTLSLDSEEADCDLFVNKDEYPGFDQYVARNISTLPVLTVTLEDAEAAKYVAGVYGYSEAKCSYHIKAVYSSPCPNNCNDRGSCKTDGTCECSNGFMGSECEVTIVTPGVEYPGYVGDLFTWQYFAFTADKLYDEIEWVVTPQDSHDHNCEMFTATDKEPTLFYFDETQFTFSDDPVSIANSEVEAGKTYYMSVNGMFGFVACNFTASIRVTDPESPTECPNNCSYHASTYNCKDNTCKCKSAYTGPECEEYTPAIVDEKKYAGYVGDGAWNYYHFTGETDNPITVILDRTTDYGDVDLYVNDGGRPALFNYSYCDVGTGTRMKLQIFEPLGHEWYIGIFGWDAANYSMKIEESSKCPCIDSNHGECLYNEEICYCNDGYAGEDCASPLITLESGQALTDQVVEMDKWNYYQISGVNASAGSLTVKEHGDVGVAWVFASIEGYPTTTEYTYSDKNHHNSTHQISYHTNGEVTGWLFIGVYGSPFIPEVDGQQSVEYDILAWVSSF